ncbi:unnamed protein product, partial [Didymodactylos carnosus]
RAKIILQSLNYDDYDYEQCQMWFSSGWSDETLSLFRYVAKECKKKETSISPLGQIFQYWIDCTPPSRDEARNKWFKMSCDNTFDMTAANLLRSEDRGHLLHYQLTGELYYRQQSSSSVDCGNIKNLIDIYQLNVQVKYLNHTPFASYHLLTHYYLSLNYIQNWIDNWFRKQQPQVNIIQHQIESYCVFSKYCTTCHLKWSYAA